MKVLWVCNIMLPVIAEALHKEASNKEGWLSGLLEQVAAENSSDLEAGCGIPGAGRYGGALETADSNATGKRRPGAFTDKCRC